jgi:penicillin amidase
MLDPPGDYIVTANNPVVAAGSGPFLSVDSDHGYRAARIEEMIEKAPVGYSVASAEAMQLDNRDGGAPNLVPHLLAVESQEKAVAEIQGLIARWADGPDAYQADPDSPGAAAYQAVWAQVLRLAFHDELPEDSWPEGGSRWFETVAALLETPEDPYWDDIGTGPVEDRDIVLEQAMADAHDELTGLLGDDPRRWRWGEIHVGHFENQSFGQSGIGPIEWLFNRTAPRRLGGGADIVNAVGFYPPDGYRVDWIPSMRMVIDLNDLDASTSMNTTGQSGHAFNSHYDDMLEPWTDGIHHPMRWTREQVHGAAEATLILSPAG